MSVNRELPHVFVLPEDNANREMANGFQLGLDPVWSRQFQVLEVAGGWLRVLDEFNDNYARSMERYPRRFMILLIDFDGKPDRLKTVRAKIPENLMERVFFLGTLTEPEKFRESLETVGLALAKDCREETEMTWGHQLLKHNASELQRLREHVRPILFPAI